jgi:hypothetical protein
VLAGALCALVLLTPSARAAEEQQIKLAIERGLSWLKSLQNEKGEWEYQESGMTSLAALTLLECGVSADEPAIQRAAMFVRGRAATETRTYSIALAIMFLDRLGEEVDVALIEAMGVRLLAGQYNDGGWTYNSGTGLPADQSGRLSEMVRKRAGEGPGPRKGPDIEKPPRSRSDLSENARRELEIVLKRGPLAVGGTAPGGGAGIPDNSNTQFAILALWTARRYGVPVEDALRRVEDRFRRNQNKHDGGWGYRNPLDTRVATSGMFNPSISSTAPMTCAALLGLAMYHASANENALRAGPKSNAKQGGNAKPPRDITDDPAVKAGLGALSTALNAPPPTKDDARAERGEQFPGGGRPRGARPPGGEGPGRGSEPPPGAQPPPGKFLPGRPQPGGVGGGVRPPGQKPPEHMIPRITFNSAGKSYYFLWSLERVGVAYGLPTIGGKDWYNWGADILVANQENDGSWQGTHGRYGADTCFALLFLRRADLARDLSASLKGKVKDEHVLRGGVKPGQLTKGIRSPFEKDDAASETDPPKATSKPPRETTSPAREKPAPTTPVKVEPDVAKLGDELIKASPSKWQKALDKLRDSKGPEYTQALAYAITQLDGQQKKATRDALAERLSNMKSSTLGQYLAEEDPELRRAAALACAMKEDKTHLGKLIDLLDDPERTVERAAYAALKDLTKQDFGPAADASDDEKAKAVKAWRTWWKKQAEK